METLLIYSIIINFLFLPICIADDPNLCATGKYRIIPKSDCQGYYFCLFGKAVDMPPCGPGAVFSRHHHVCVRKGSIYDDCTPGEVDVPEKPLTIDEQCENGATLIPHPSECQTYYNCSLRYQHVPRYFEQHMQECQYPQLFSKHSKKCDHFETVDCGKRKETTDGLSTYERTPLECSQVVLKSIFEQSSSWSECEYRANRCKSAHCIPCRVRIPSCTGKPDGIHAHDDRPWSPYFITCYKQRSVSMDVCPPDSDGRTQLFHMDIKECVPLDMVPQEHGGTMPNCEGKEDGNYLDDAGRCNQFTVCRSGGIEEIVKCKEGEVFDALKQECLDSEKACGPCGGLSNC